jgi:hypothetical protein
MMPLPQTYKINSVGSLSKCSCSVVHKSILFAHNHISNMRYWIDQYLMVCLIKTHLI